MKVENNLERIQKDMSTGITKTPPTKEAIWNNLKQRKNIYRTQREFIFKIIKNIQRVGKYWKNIPGCKDRVNCQTCHSTESMEHILTECEIIGQAEIWDLVKEIWERKYDDWRKPNFGEIMGCASAAFYDENGKYNIGKTRLYQILISEAAHIIWTIRCKRVISDNNNQQKWPTNQSLSLKLNKQINHRL
jgi:hypothetical protein